MKKSHLLAITYISIPFLFSCNPINVDRVTIEGEASIEIGQTTQYKSEVLPKEATTKNVTWSCSNNDVAYIDSDGNVTGIKEGKVTITGTSGNKSDSKTLLIGGYIEKHVTNINITAEKTEIEEGNCLYLKTEFSPSDADNKNIKYTSSNKEIASVNEYGVVVGEKASNEVVTITGISEDGNFKSTFNLTVRERTTHRNIKGFAEPKLKLYFENALNNKVAIINEKEINKDNSNKYKTTNFYEDGNSTYKVGNLNPFKYKSSISWGDNEWQDLLDNNPFQEYVLLVKNGTDWTEGAHYLSKTNNKQNEFQFNSSAIGNHFKLTIKPDSKKYSGITSSMESSLEFDVIEGYNVYDYIDFTVIDNWTTNKAKEVLGAEHEIFQKNEFVDCWDEFKKENNVPTNIDINSIILHDNIHLKNSILPKYISWTKKETEDFINGLKDPITKERFDNFVDIKSNIHQTDWKNYPVSVRRAKCYYMLINSLKDVELFYRYQNNSDFLMEGNYFLLDISEIKPICAFNIKAFDQYQSMANHTTAFITFNGGKERFNHTKTDDCGEYRYDYFKPYREANPNYDFHYTIKNTFFKGNSPKNELIDDGIGGLQLIYTHSCLKIENCILTEFFNGLNLNSSDKENSISEINKCKIYNIFNRFIHAPGSEKIIIKDSFMTDAGATGIYITEDVPGILEFEKRHRKTNIETNNTYIECFVSGNEILNKNTFSHIIINILAAMGLNAFEKYRTLNFDTLPCDHRNFIKIEEGVVKVNMICLQLYDPVLNAREPGLSTIKINDQSTLDLPEDSKNGSVFDIYNSMDITSSLALSFTLKSSKGGHAKLPINKIAESDDLLIYDNTLPGSTTSEQTTMLSNYSQNQKEFDSKYPSVTQNVANLFSGDYLTVYIKPLINYMFGAVLGYK